MARNSKPVSRVPFQRRRCNTKTRIKARKTINQWVSINQSIHHQYYYIVSIVRRNHDLILSRHFSFLSTQSLPTSPVLSNHILPDSAPPPATHPVTLLSRAVSHRSKLILAVSMYVVTIGVVSRCSIAASSGPSAPASTSPLASWTSSEKTTRCSWSTSVTITRSPGAGERGGGGRGQRGQPRRRRPAARGRPRSPSHGHLAPGRGGGRSERSASERSQKCIGRSHDTQSTPADSIHYTDYCHGRTDPAVSDIQGG